MGVKTHRKKMNTNKTTTTTSVVGGGGMERGGEEVAMEEQGAGAEEMKTGGEGDREEEKEQAIDVPWTHDKLIVDDDDDVNATRIIDCEEVIYIHEQSQPPDRTSVSKPAEDRPFVIDDDVPTACWSEEDPAPLLKTSDLKSVRQSSSKLHERDTPLPNKRERKEEEEERKKDKYDNSIVTGQGTLKDHPFFRQWKEGQFTTIVVLTGAGISTSSGIPDFRSKGGLYEKLSDANLPITRPEDVFRLDFYQNHFLDFVQYILEPLLAPSQSFQSSNAHKLLMKLHQQSKLEMNFSQNIDDLERLTGLPNEKVIQCHGCMNKFRCSRKECDHGGAYTFSYISCWAEQQQREKNVKQGPPKCKCDKSNAIIRPDIVFFDEPLPSRFYTEQCVIKQADLMLVMGTRLAVDPFNTLLKEVKKNTQVVLINNQELDECCTPFLPNKFLFWNENIDKACEYLLDNLPEE